MRLRCLRKSCYSNFDKIILGLTTRSKKLLGAPGLATRSKKLLGAPGLATRSKKLLGAPGLATRSKDATRGSWPRY